MRVSLARQRKRKLYRWLRENHDGFAELLRRAKSPQGFWKKAARYLSSHGFRDGNYPLAPSTLRYAWELAERDHIAGVPVPKDDPSGHVYVLPVPQKPWLVKVGMTGLPDRTRLEIAAVQLAERDRPRIVPSTHRDAPLIRAADRRAAEAATHLVLERYRVPGWGREVFCVPVELAARAAGVAARLCSEIDPGSPHGYLDAVVEAALLEITELSQPIPEGIAERIREEERLHEERQRLREDRNRPRPPVDFDANVERIWELHRKSVRDRAQRGRHLRLVGGTEHLPNA